MISVIALMLRLPYPFLHLLQRQDGRSHADHGDVQLALLYHRQVTGEDDDDERVGRLRRRLGNLGGIRAHAGVSCGFFDMAAESMAHRRQYLVSKAALAERREALVERRDDDVKGGEARAARAADRRPFDPVPSFLDACVVLWRFVDQACCEDARHAVRITSCRTPSSTSATMHPGVFTPSMVSSSASAEAAARTVIAYVVASNR